MAKITRTATLTSATCNRIGSSSSPKKVVSAPNGTTANAENAAVAEMIGASAKRIGSAAPGRSSSLNISLMTSANGCSSPCQPTRIGPSRCCSSAASRRSTHTIAAAECSSAMKTNSVRTIWAMSSVVIRVAQPFRAAQCLMRPHRLARPPFRRQRAAPFLDVRLVLVAEMLQRRQHRRHRRVAERAQRLAGDVVRDALQHVEVAHLPLAALDAAQDLVEPVGALAAGRALAARLVAVEVQQVLRQPHHAGGVVEDDDRRRPEQ